MPFSGTSSRGVKRRLDHQNNPDLADIGSGPPAFKRPCNATTRDPATFTSALSNAFSTVRNKLKKFIFGDGSSNNKHFQEPVTIHPNNKILLNSARHFEVLSGPRGIATVMSDHRPSYSRHESEEVQYLGQSLPVKVATSGSSRKSEDDNDVEVVREVLSASKANFRFSQTQSSGSDWASPPRRKFIVSSRTANTTTNKGKSDGILGRLKNISGGRPNISSNFNRKFDVHKKSPTRKSLLTSKMIFKSNNGTPSRRTLRNLDDFSSCFRPEDKQAFKMALFSNKFNSTSQRGFNSINSPFFNRKQSGAVFKTQLTPEETRLRTEQLEFKHKKNEEPEVITLDEDDTPIAGSSTSFKVLENVSRRSSSDDSNEEVKIVSEKKKFFSERPRARSDDHDVLEIISRYCPDLPPKSQSASKPPMAEPSVKKFNSLEAELKSKPVFNEDFCQMLRNKYDVRQKAYKKQIELEQVKANHASDVNRRNEQIVAERLRKHLSITDVAIEEDEEEEEAALPDITPEMEETIKRACHSRGETLIDKFNIPISRKDVDTLKGLNWLNDEVINFYMQLIVERSSKTDNWPKVYAFNTFFYPKIVSTGHSAVKRWTRKVDIFSYDILLIPVHLGMHWCLGIIDLRKPGVFYYDSMLGNNTDYIPAALRYLKDEHMDKKKQPLDTSGYEKVLVKNIPQQMNGSDCGMFTCKFAEYLSRDADISFDQGDMPYFRRRMIYEIVTSNLMHP